MKTLAIEIPEQFLISAKIPRNHLEADLKRELALQLYRENMISFLKAFYSHHIGRTLARASS